MHFCALNFRFFEIFGLESDRGGPIFRPSCSPLGRALFEAEGVISPPSADVERNGETRLVSLCLT